MLGTRRLLAPICVLALGAVAVPADAAEAAAKPGVGRLSANVARSGETVLVTGRVRGVTRVRATWAGGCSAKRLRRQARRFRLRVRAGKARGCRAPSGRRARVLVVACRRRACARARVKARQRLRRARGRARQLPKLPPARVFVAPSGSDALACTRAAPCASFDRAFRAAAPGQVVEVAGGSYPAQRIGHDPSKTSASDVYFRPAPGADVTVAGNIEVYGSHLSLIGMRARDTDIPYDGPVPVTDVSFWNMDARNFTFDSATHINVFGGDYGPASACGGPYGGGNNGIRKNGEAMPSNILIEGATIHDIQSQDLGDCHVECLIVGAGQGITVRNTVFWNCSIFDIFLQPFNGPISGITLENNWFAEPTGLGGQVNSDRAVEFSGRGPWRDILIRHNSSTSKINLSDGAPNPVFDGVRVIGNIGARACFDGAVYRYNAWLGGGCDATDRALRGRGFPFSMPGNGSGLDYHLTGGVARDLVPASASDIGQDIDGEARPLGSRRDAGADEAR